MKKFLTIFAIGVLSYATGQTNAFKGADFENFSDFTNSLNSYGLKTYATQDSGKGVENSAALKIETTPTENDYVFTANATEALPEKIKEIILMVNGNADKSLSVNLYKTDGSSYKFNIGDLHADSKINITDSNNYNGKIDTKGKYVKVTLDCTKLKSINKDSSKNFLAIKIGKDVSYNLDIDAIKVISAD